MAKPRVVELDFMRATAMIMVVMLHVSAAYVAYSPVGSNVFYLGLLLNQWSRICLPLFVFVSGFGLFYGYGQKTKLDLKEFYSRRFYMVFVPYLIWSFIYMILRDIFNPSFYFIGLPVKEAFFSYITWTFKENIHTPIWFVLLIVQLYFIFPVLLSPVARIKKPIQSIMVNSLFFLVVITYLRFFMTMSGIHVIDWLQRYYSVNLIGWYFYFILGGIVAQNWSMFKKIPLNKFGITLLYIITTSLVILEAYLGFLKYGQPHLEVYTSIRPTVLINSMAAIPAIYLFAQKTMGWDKLANFLKDISRYSYGIFFIHPQVLTVVKKVVGRLYGTYTTRVFQLFLVFVLTMVCSYVFCYIVDRTPFRTILLGVGKRK